MKITEKTKRRLRYVFVSMMIICITPLCERGRMLKGAHSENAYAGETIICAIDLGDDMYGSHGLETGFNYELLNRFAQDNHCEVKVVVSGRNDNYIDSLRAGQVDILITHDKDSLEGIGTLMELNECSAWAVGNTDSDRLRQLNTWISHAKSSPDFEQLQNSFHTSYNPLKRAERGVISNRISPYDDLFKEYAAGLGWDWRMLAAVVYQESKFSIGSSSARGAQGLMQVMPKTGEYYGVSDLLDPEQNIIAGTSHLKRLQRMFGKYGLDHEELVKFTLAAYNAGEGRIADCRNFAVSMQKDSTKWDSIVEIIPLMRDDSILEEESVKLGKFQGYETIAYVENIMEIYKAICQICPQN